MESEGVVCSSGLPFHMSNSETPPQREKTPYIIGICGGSASGKTTLAENIVKELNSSHVLLKMDNFYKPLSKEDHVLANQSRYNFDEPRAFDMDLLVQVLKQLKARQVVNIPVYDFIHHSRNKEFMRVEPSDVVVFEGILAWYDDRISNLLDIKIFVDLDKGTRLQRRLIRDVETRGWTRENVVAQYQSFVEPAFVQYIEPCRKKADLTFYGGDDVDEIIDFIMKFLAKEIS